MSSSLYPRLAAQSLLALTLLAAGLVQPASGDGVPPPQPFAPERTLPPDSPPPTPAPVPPSRDEAGVWSAAERTKLTQTIHDLFRRYGCQVVIETYRTLPEGQGDGVDLSDHAAVDRVLIARIHEHYREAARTHARLRVILVFSSRGERFAHGVWSLNSALGKEDRDTLANEVRDRLRGHFVRGVPDTLAHIGAFLERKQPDSNRLQGRWVLTKLVTPTTELTGEKTKLYYVNFAADHVTIGRGEKKFIDGQFSVHVEANPRRIDISSLQDGKKVSLPSGIYSLTGDTLTLRLFDSDRLSNPEKPAPPTDFENIANGDKNDLLFVLRRPEEGRRAAVETKKPHIHDEAGYWSEADRARITETIQDIYRRFQCKVFLESYLKMPPELTKDVDLADAAAKNRVFTEWAKKRGADLSGPEPGVSILVLVCKEINLFRTEVTWRTAGRSWTKEEQGLAQRMSSGMDQRLGGKIVQGMPDALTFLADTLQANQELVSGRSASAPSLPPPDRPQTTEQPPAGDNEGSSAADREAFQSAALAAGLSIADVNALVTNRGPASIKDLTDFLNDQVKEGRKGNDLKKDLEIFIRVFKEKVGK